MLFFPWSVLILSGLCFLGVGFAWGRRYGQREGILQGQREAPLLLRHASLLAGHCLLCQQSASISPAESIHPLALPTPKHTPL